MSRFSVRFWFCVAAAIVAAAIADPIVEFASNAHLFGRGDFTDHSNLDVLPALLVGFAFAALHVTLGLRGLLSASGPSGRFLRASSAALRPGVVKLLPVILAIQLVALFVMETGEQIVTVGHALGGTYWLGGPVLVSLAAHAAVCAIVTFAMVRAVRALACATLTIVRFVRALGQRPLRTAPPAVRRRAGRSLHATAIVALSSIGERAPPLLS